MAGVIVAAAGQPMGRVALEQIGAVIAPVLMVSARSDSLDLSVPSVGAAGIDSSLRPRVLRDALRALVIMRQATAVGSIMNRIVGSMVLSADSITALTAARDGLSRVVPAVSQMHSVQRVALSVHGVNRDPQVSARALVSALDSVAASGRRSRERQVRVDLVPVPMVASDDLRRMAAVVIRTQGVLTAAPSAHGAKRADLRIAPRAALVASLLAARGPHSRVRGVLSAGEASIGAQATAAPRDVTNVAVDVLAAQAGDSEVAAPEVVPEVVTVAAGNRFVHAPRVLSSSSAP